MSGMLTLAKHIFSQVCSSSRLNGIIIQSQIETISKVYIL